MLADQLDEKNFKTGFYPNFYLFYVLQLEVDGHIELCSHVYNRRAGAWEPLIEPIEQPVLKQFKRWELNVKASVSL